MIHNCRKFNWTFRVDFYLFLRFMLIFSCWFVWMCVRERRRFEIEHERKSSKMFYTFCLFFISFTGNDKHEATGETKICGPVHFFQSGPKERKRNHDVTRRKALPPFTLATSFSFLPATVTHETFSTRYFTIDKKFCAWPNFTRFCCFENSNGDHEFLLFFSATAKQFSKFSLLFQKSFK